MIYILWEFTIAAEHREEFEQIYSSAGDWAQLFRRDPQYRETVLIKDEGNPQCYMTIDVWEDRNSYTSFKERFADEYEKLDQRCEALTQGERHIGVFERT